MLLRLTIKVNLKGFSVISAGRCCSAFQVFDVLRRASKGCPACGKSFRGHVVVFCGGSVRYILPLRLMGGSTACSRKCFTLLDAPAIRQRAIKSLNYK